MFGPQVWKKGGGMPFSEGGFGRVLVARFRDHTIPKTGGKVTSFSILIRHTDENGDYEGEEVHSLELIRLCDVGKVNIIAEGTDVETIDDYSISGNGKFAKFVESILSEEVGISDYNTDTSVIEGQVFEFARRDDPEDWNKFAAKNRNKSKGRGRRGVEVVEEDARKRTHLIAVSWNDQAPAGEQPEDWQAAVEKAIQAFGQGAAATEESVDTPPTTRRTARRGRDAETGNDVSLPSDENTRGVLNTLLESHGTDWEMPKTQVAPLLAKNLSDLPASVKALHIRRSKDAAWLSDNHFEVNDESFWATS